MGACSAGGRLRALERAAAGLLLCFVLLFTAAVPAASAQTERYKTVRVGYYQSGKFQEGDGENTLRSGYGYEYLQKVASYTGWKYEYVPGEWDELYQMLADGRIDLLAGVSYREERAGEVLYPDYEMLKETFYIYKDSDDASIRSGDISSYAGKKIGVVDDVKMTDSINIWAEQNHADLSVVTFPSLDACADAFNHGQIDGFVSADNIVSGYSGISPVEMIGRVPYYICAAKNRPDLLEALNSALSLINGQDSAYLTALKNKYTADTSISIFLSKQEQDWLNENRQIRVGYLDDYMPYSGTGKDGTVQGLLRDTLTDLFAVLPGDSAPEITYIGYQDQENMVQALRQNEVDVIFPVSGEHSYAEQNGYQQSSVVIQAAVDMVYADRYADAKLDRIAINRNNQLQYQFTKSNYPGAELVLRDSVEECLSAVKHKKADCTLIEALRAAELAGDDRKLQVAPLSATCDFCFGVNYGDSGFLRVLNHGLSMLGEEYGLSHTYQYIGDIVTVSVQDAIRTNFGIFYVLIAVFVLAVVFVKYKSLQKFSEAEAQHNQALQDALMKAHQASYAKRVFLHSMSHDIRTPLNAILGILEINQKSSDPRQIAENTRKAREAVGQLLTMTDNMIHMSRLESGEMLDLRQDVDFARILSEVEQNQKHRAEEAGVTFFHERDEKLASCPHVYGNDVCFREILDHTLGNAVKYTRPGGQVCWKEELQQENAGTLRYRCTITDTGIGMKPEFLQYIFEPFAQERYDARTTYQGSGLGLAIVKALLDKMNGSIEITSEENVGTTVSMEVPLEVVPAEEPDGKNLPAEPETVSHDLTGMKILLAEDNELNVEIEQYMLEDAGAAVTVARDGAQALEEYQKAPEGAFDAVLMDIMMPVMNGYEAAAAIRGSGRADAAAIPIIATTACVTEDVRRDGASAGLTEYIEKPLDRNRLMQTLRSFCRNK